MTIPIKNYPQKPKYILKPRLLKRYIFLQQREPVSEKLRYLAEFRAAQQRLGELRSMLDPDLFLAQLKKPEVIRGGANTELSAETPRLLEYLKGLIDLSRKAAEVLMEYERFLREDLAAKPIRIRIDTDTDVKQLMNKLDEFFGKASSLAKAFEEYEEVLVDDTNFNLLEVDKVVKDVRVLMESVSFSAYYTERFFQWLYNLFATNPVKDPDSIFVPKNLFEYASEARKHGILNLAADIERIALEIGKQVLDPQTAEIVLSRAKVKPLYVLIDTLTDEFKAAYGRFDDKTIKDVLYVLDELRFGLHISIDDATEIVDRAYKLRDTLTKLGYKSPSQRLTFYLPPTHIYTPKDAEQYLPDELTFSLFFNDLAYVIHRVAEMLLFYTNYLGQYVDNSNMFVLKFRRCDVPVYSMTNSGSLISFAIAWLNSICHLIYSGWVKGEDIDPLSGYILTDTTAWFRVGSAQGHATHVVKDGDTWVVEYYDTDRLVNRLLGRLWSVVPGVEVYVDDEYGVTVKTKDDKVLPFIGAILGFATSMDIQINEHGKSIIDRIIQHAEEISPQLALIAKAAFGVGK
jgi:hypothetical protein